MDLNNFDEKVILENFSFKKPKNFVEKVINSENSVKLEDVNNNIIIYFSSYGRDGNYARDEYNHIKNNIVQDNDLKLISSRKFKTYGLTNYNVFFYNKVEFTSIYLFHKYNKTFRVSFVLPDKFDSSLKVFKSIVNSLKKK